jgi:hypothetical protein
VKGVCMENDCVPSRKRFFDAFKKIAVGFIDDKSSLNGDPIYVLSVNISDERFMKLHDFFKFVVYVHPLVYLFEDESFIQEKFIFYNGSNQDIILELANFGLFFKGAVETPEIKSKPYNKDKVDAEWA